MMAQTAARNAQQNRIGPNIAGRLIRLVVWGLCPVKSVAKRDAGRADGWMPRSVNQALHYPGTRKEGANDEY
jgi:hypothetical protein